MIGLPFLSFYSLISICLCRFCFFFYGLNSFFWLVIVLSSFLLGFCESIVCFWLWLLWGYVLFLITMRTCFTLMRSEVAQSCVTLCDLMDCSLPGFSICGIFQARVLEWVAISFSRRSSQTQGLNPGLLHCRQMIYPLSH